MDKLKKRKPMKIMDEQVMRNIIDALFITHVLALNTEFVSFSAEELKVAAVGPKPGKAPGPDSLSPEVIREIVSQSTELLLYNVCLTEYVPRVQATMHAGYAGNCSRGFSSHGLLLLLRIMADCLLDNMVFEPVVVQLIP